MKRIISLILSLVLVISVTSIGIPAKANDTLFDISLSTDKPTYGISENAVITVTVKNISNKKIDGVVISVKADNYLLDSQKKTVFDVGTLDTGKSKSFSFKAVVSRKANGLKFFDKLSLFFKQIFKKYTSLTPYIPEHKDYESADFTVTHSYLKIPVTVKAWYTVFSSQELSDMKTVDDCLAESENINDGLDSLLKRGLIKNIVNGNGINWFTYSNGTLGGVMTAGFSDTAEDTSQPEGTISTISQNQHDAYDQCCIGKALILYSFNYPSDLADQNYRRPFYDSKDSTSLVNQWGLKQVMTDVDDEVTVNDIKNIDKSYAIVCFSGHGSTLGTTPVMCLTEKVTDENKQEYADDLVNKRIVTVTYDGGTYYWVMPSLFECYKSNNLDGKLIFFQCCEAFGEGENENHQFADTVIQAGADAAVGFHNSVNSKYGRSFMASFISSYIEGKTVNEAFNATKEALGSTDAPYKPKGEPIAEPVMRGNGNSTFLNDKYQSVKVKIHNDNGEIIHTVSVRAESRDAVTAEYLSKAIQTLYGYSVFIFPGSVLFEEEGSEQVAHMFM